MPENKGVNINKKFKNYLKKNKILKKTSFLQVEEEKSPKMQCSCKFIKSSSEFLQNTLNKVNKVVSTNNSDVVQKTEFIEMKVKNNLVNKDETKIIEPKKNGNNYFVNFSKNFKIFLLNFFIEMYLIFIKRKFEEK